MLNALPATVDPIVDLLAYQRRDIESTARFCWSCWSRQTGKSFGKGLKRLLRGIRRRKTQIMISAGLRQSRELMEKVQMHARALQMATTLDESVKGGYFDGVEFNVLELRVPNGVRMLSLPANPATVRGYTGDVLFDEHALHRDDREIWGALFPSIMRVEGEIDSCSTPKGKRGVFYELMNNAEYEHSIVTIHDAVRDGLRVDVEQLRRAMNDAELFRQEFECEFVDEATAFLTYEMIAACERADCPLPVSVSQGQDALAVLAELIESIDQDEECYLGWDVGRSQDLSCFWIWRKLGALLKTRGIAVLRGIRFSQQQAVFNALMERKGVRRAAIDATKGSMGQPLAEAAQERWGEWRVDAVNFTLESKGKMAGQVRTKVQDLSLHIPACEQIRNSWHSIQKQVTTGGTVRYLAERTPDGHADEFWAGALGVDAAGEGAAGAVSADQVHSASSSRYRDHPLETGAAPAPGGTRRQMAGV